MQIYASKNRIIFWLVFSIILPLATLLLLYWILEPKDLNDKDAHYFLIGVIGLTFIGPFFSFLHLRKFQISINNESIIICGLLGCKKINISEYESYEIQSSMGIISLELYKKFTRKPFKILTLEGVDEKWADEHFSKLLTKHTELVIKSEISEILKFSNGQSGDYVYKRSEKAKTIFRRISIISSLLSVYALWKPVPYDIILIILLIIPIAIIPLLNKYKEYIRLSPSQKSLFADASSLVIMPGFVLLLRAFIDWRILDYQAIVMPAIIIGFSIGFLVLWPLFKVVGNKAIIAALMLFMAYGVGGAVYINCAYDRSQSEIYSVKIIDFNINHGKSTSYYVVVDQFYGQNNKKVKISKAKYTEFNRGDYLTIYAKKGKFGIPWYYL